MKELDMDQGRLAGRFETLDMGFRCAGGQA